MVSMDPKRTLSEISHLFLSEMRERQGASSAGGAVRPTRIPPGKSKDSTAPVGAAPVPQTMPADDMSPEEFVESMASDARRENDTRPLPATSGATARVSVVIASHLTDHPAEQIRQYARHLASQYGRIGLIEADSGEFGITCLEPQGDTRHEHGAMEAPVVLDELDGRRMSEILAELSFDVDRWIVSLPNPRTTEAREVLRLAPHWVLLTTSDHDGVVATYRALKGLAVGEAPAMEGADAKPGSAAGASGPRLSLVVLDAKDEAHANAVFRKLDAVSRQFLSCAMESELPVRPVADVAENVLLHCRATRDKAQLANAPQWKIVGNFLSAAIAPESTAAATDLAENQAVQDAQTQLDAIQSARHAPPTNNQQSGFASHSQPAQPAGQSIHGTPIHGSQIQGPTMQGTTMQGNTMRSTGNGFSSQQHFASAGATHRGATSSSAPRLAVTQDDSFEEILELADDCSTESILDAVVRQGGAAGAWVQCPLKAPSCPQAILAVGRDQHLVLLAVAGRGLTELRAIGLALRWMEENRELIRMALPQLAIDPQAAPEVRLLVDHADLTADLLQPLLQSGTVNVQAYRRVKWGRKTGLLLEAA